MKYWDMNIQGDVQNLNDLMRQTVHGFPFESSQETGMNDNFKSALEAFLHRYETPIVKITSHPEKVIVDVTNSNI